jgi:peptide/nickel transport system ATP-binding protein
MSAQQHSPLVPQSSPLIEVRDLKTYFKLDEGTVKAVDGVTFDIYRGQTLGIVGESGSGKSITARSILRIVGPPGEIVSGQMLYHRRPKLPHSATETGSRGEVDSVVDLAKLDSKGKEIRGIRGAEIAMIFQEPMTSFSPVHTVGDQITEAIRLHQPLTKQQARELAADLLNRVGISRPVERLNEYAYQLSGGMRQRAMIAMALSCSPGLLLADEPTTALDVTTQAQILDLIRRLKDDTGAGIVMITHDLGVIAEIAERVVVMYLGRVVETADVRSLFRDPKHPYTRALLASIPRVGRRSRERLRPVQGMVPSPFNRPKGCPFQTRCPEMMPGVCDVVEPPLISIGPGRDVSCHLYTESPLPPAPPPCAGEGSRLSADSPSPTVGRGGRGVRACSSAVYRWQLTSRPAPTGISGGSTTSQTPGIISGQRVWNGHPFGRLNGLGTIPWTGRKRSRERRPTRGIEASSARVYGCFGSRNSERTSAVSTTRPRYITTTRSAISAITPRSWVIMTMPAPVSSFSRRIRSRIWAWVVTSSAVVGSSASSRPGLHESAIAIIARCRIPPESWYAYSFRRSAGREMPTLFSRSAASSFACCFESAWCSKIASVI